MNMFRRLFDVARANLNHRRPPSAESFEPDWEPPADTGDPSAETPPGQDPRLAQYYANLEVPYGSDLATVRKAWKNLLRQYHPDLHSADPEKAKVAQELSQGLNEAFRELEKHLK